jgi:hypothetical protein
MFFPLSSSSVFSTAAAAPRLAAVAAPPEASSCSSAAPRIARKPCHRLSASPLSSPTHATPLRRRLKLPRCAAGRQQHLQLTVPLLGSAAHPEVRLDFFCPLIRLHLASSTSPPLSTPPDHRRALCLPSSATSAAPRPQFRALPAPLHPTEAS